MSRLISIVFCLVVGLVQAQYSGRNLTTPVDSTPGVQMITAIEESLNLFYEEMAPSGNYDSIIDALNYEASTVPEFSDSVYCARLNVMNEMSPFHLDCNDQTLSTIKFFTQKRRGFVRVVLGRSKLYFDMFEEKLAEHNMPIELKYLAVIESGLRPQVKSRAGALGLWQFMYRTGLMYGLNENSYIDERMDPELATEAACRYLKKLYEIYNDWNLALAAYNAGPGNVNKAIRRSGNKLTYWEVRPFLPKETQGYVPNFIAAAYLMTYHAEHNIVPMEATVTYNQLDTMCLQKGVHFSSISKLLSIDEEEVKRLNPIYKRDYIPKTDPQQCISLPMPLIGQLVSGIDSLYEIEYSTFTAPTTPITHTNPVVNNTTPTVETPAGSYEYYMVKSGETLGTIASRFGTTVGAIQQMNGLNSTRIYVGQRLKVKAGSGAATTQTTPTPTNTAKYYTVRSGDTFGKIAQRHNKSQTQLKRLNPSVNIDRLSIGQKIRVR
jgi:membrane-bound lytic murein transglycosylase D